MIERETAEEVDLSNRVTLEIGSASFRSVRGRTVIAALCDEVSFWRSEESANPDVEILDALRPALATVPGSMLVCASSPYARRGALWAAHRRWHGKDGAPVLVWQAATRTLNPTIPQRVVDEAYDRDPIAAAAEWGASFRSDVAAFVEREVVDACTVPGRYELPRLPATRHLAFCDAAGGSGSDSMTLAIAHAERDGTGPTASTRAVLDLVREVKPPFSPEAVTADFAAVLKSYGLTRVEGDKYAGSWPAEQFGKFGISYDAAAKPKSDLYRDALPLLNSGRAELLDLPKLAAQFCGLERRTARGGRDSIDHSPGGHDDVANAAAGALLLAVGGGAASTYDRWRALS